MLGWVFAPFYYTFSYLGYVLIYLKSIFFVLLCDCLFYVLFALISDAYTAGLVKYREPYPFGVDPSWRGSRSELPFLNSLKMKMSILLGVTQMNLGIILSYFDARFFGSSLDIRFVFLSTSIPLTIFPASSFLFFIPRQESEVILYLGARYQFVPQLIFLNSLFGYLSLLIIIKWCTGSQADLYHVMIYMFLSPTDDLGENELFWGQRPLQAWFLFFHLFMKCTYVQFRYFQI